MWQLLFCHYQLSHVCLTSMIPLTLWYKQTLHRGTGEAEEEMGHLAVTVQTGGSTPSSRKQNSEARALTTHSPHDGCWLWRSQSVHLGLQERWGGHREGNERPTELIKTTDSPCVNKSDYLVGHGNSSSLSTLDLFPRNRKTNTRARDDWWRFTCTVC